MQKIRILVLTVCFCCLTGAVFAGTSAEIGTSFPVGHTAHMPTEAGENSASFTCDALVMEVSVHEDRGGLHMEMTLRNPTDQPIHITHPNGQMYDFVIFAAKDKELYRWSAGRAFTEAVTGTDIPEHGSLIYAADIKRAVYRKFRNEAMFVRMYVKDTSYSVTLQIPREAGTEAGSPVTLHGSIELGSYHGW